MLNSYILELAMIFSNYYPIGNMSHISGVANNHD